METKRCSTCNEVKELNQFRKDSRYSQGVKGQCTNCLNLITSKRYHENPDKYKEKMKNWMQSTPHLTEKRLIRAYTKYLTERGFSVIFGTPTSI
jgi:hypothetical protein